MLFGKVWELPKLPRFNQVSKVQFLNLKIPAAVPPQARRGNAPLKRFNTSRHRLHVRSSRRLPSHVRTDTDGVFLTVKTVKKRSGEELPSSRTDVASPRWSRSDVTRSLFMERARERERDMFDDDNQSVARMMKPRRKQETVPSPAAVRPATGRRQSDDDRFNPELNCPPAFISSLRSPVTKTGPQCSSRVRLSSVPSVLRQIIFALLWFLV